ncbi:MAG: hypothetical protein E7499_03310 [Ruminococcus sp.]|nr:hypothetical protein [Ruminococcus sp.]
MKNSYEIERKYLIAVPDFSKLNILNRRDIIQTYLKKDEKGLQRRVRKITEAEKTFYIYTEKKFLSPLVREELEYEITADEYLSFLKQAETSLVPVEKTRYDFSFREQLFEIDVYSFDSDFAIMELEIDSPEQEIFLPDFIKVIKEVTDDGRYSNASLAIAGTFPYQ